jgi:hypothetical protein
MDLDFECIHEIQKKQVGYLVTMCQSFGNFHPALLDLAIASRNHEF